MLEHQNAVWRVDRGFVELFRRGEGCYAALIPIQGARFTLRSGSLKGHLLFIANGCG